MNADGEGINSWHKSWGPSFMVCAVSLMHRHVFCCEWEGLEGADIGGLRKIPKCRMFSFWWVGKWIGYWEMIRWLTNLRVPVNWVQSVEEECSGNKVGVKYTWRLLASRCDFLGRTKQSKTNQNKKPSVKSKWPLTEFQGPIAFKNQQRKGGVEKWREEQSQGNSSILKDENGKDAKLSSRSANLNFYQQYCKYFPVLSSHPHSTLSKTEHYCKFLVQWNVE